MIAGLVSNSAEVPCRVSKGSLMEAENVIVKIAGEEKERKENGILQPGRPWIGASASSFSQSVSARTLNRQHLCLSPKICVSISVGVSDLRRRRRKERDCGEDYVPIFEDFSFEED